MTPATTQPTTRQLRAIAAACRIMDGADKPPTLAVLAARVHLSPCHLQRLFKSITGISPREYAAARRAGRLRESLRTRGDIAASAYAAGYGASSRFYADARGRLGMQPAAWRAGGAGERIRFAVGECSLGSVLVAATGTGIAAILLGDDPDRLTRDLQDQFPRADLIGAEPGFERTVAQVVRLVDQPTVPVALPLDIRGTAFQQKVWRALRRIPPGKTLSYAELAARIGRPTATRAVASACASNHIAVAIPCHRVVRTDGSLSGYRWGVERKAALLAREQAAGGTPVARSKAGRQPRR